MRALGPETAEPSSRSLLGAPTSSRRNNRLDRHVLRFAGGRGARLPFPVSVHTMQLRHLAPAALIVASSACFATRNDVRILQEDIHSLRALQIRADSARTRQLAEMSVSLNNTLGSVKDSVRDLGTRLTTFQGATRQEFYSMGQQLLQLGERLGQSQAAMQNFRADLEERNRQFVEQAVRSTVPPPAPGDTTKVAAPPARLTEGPNVLYQIGRDQLMNNSWSAARDAFNQLLTQHPASDRVPEAMA